MLHQHSSSAQAMAITDDVKDCHPTSPQVVLTSMASNHNHNHNHKIRLCESVPIPLLSLQALALSSSPPRLDGRWTTRDDVEEERMIRLGAVPRDDQPRFHDGDALLVRLSGDHAVSSVAVDEDEDVPILANCSAIETLDDSSNSSSNSSKDDTDKDDDDDDDKDDDDDDDDDQSSGTVYELFDDLSVLTADSSMDDDLILLVCDESEDDLESSDFDLLLPSIIFDPTDLVLKRDIMTTTTTTTTPTTTSLPPVMFPVANATDDLQLTSFLLNFCSVKASTAATTYA